MYDTPSTPCGVCILFSGNYYKGGGYCGKLTQSAQPRRYFIILHCGLKEERWGLRRQQLFDFPDRRRKGVIIPDLFFHLGTGGDDRCMIPAAEFITDLHIREIQQFAAKIDGDMPCTGDILRTCLSGDLLACQAVVIRYGLDDLSGG